MLDKFDVDWINTLYPEYKRPIGEWSLQDKIDFIGTICRWRVETSFNKGDNEEAKVYDYISNMVQDLNRNRVVESYRYKKLSKIYER